MDKLGFIPNPEQYAPAGDEVIFDNSIDALEFFQDFYGGNGVVLLASISLNNLACSNMLVWVYFDLDAQDIRSLAPVFKLDNPEVFHECEFTKLLPLTNEIFLFWRETLYSTVFTSAGEVAIKKVRAVLSEADMLNILRLEGAFEAEDVYPVELYSLQQEKFACICWSIEQKEKDTDDVVWHPVCKDDEKLLDAFDGDTLTEYPVELGETATIGGELFKLCYNAAEGKHFEKVSAQQNALKTAAGEKFRIIPGQHRQPGCQKTAISGFSQKSGGSVNGNNVQKETRAAAGNGFATVKMQTDTANGKPKIIQFKPKR